MKNDNDYDITLLCRYISSELNNIRRIKKINIKDVASDLGYGAWYLRSIEGGKQNKLSLKTYAMLAIYYNVSLFDVIRNARIKKELDDTYRSENDNISVHKDKYEIELEAEEICKQISLALKNYRKEQKLLAEDVSFDLDISSSYLSSIENGKQKKLSLNTYIKIAAYYDLSLDDVIKIALTEK